MSEINMLRSKASGTTNVVSEHIQNLTLLNETAILQLSQKIVELETRITNLENKLQELKN